MRSMSKKVFMMAGLLILLAACSGKGSTTTTTSSTSTTTSTTTTSTTTTSTTTIPVAPEISTPAETIPVIKTEGRKTAGPCVGVSDADYCVWGTRPIDKTITNSRRVAFDSLIEQGFTSMSDSLDTVEMDFESKKNKKIYDSIKK